MSIHYLSPLREPLVAPYCSLIFQELKKKYAHDHEIAALKNLLPGEGDPNAAGVAASQDRSNASGADRIELCWNKYVALLEHLTPPNAQPANDGSQTPLGGMLLLALIRTDTTLDHSQKAEKVNAKMWYEMC